MKYLLSDDNLTSVFEDMFDIAQTDDFGCSYLDNKLIHCQSLSNVEHCKIKEGTEIICDMAFGENRNLKSISIPSSVKIIGVEAFSNCRNLETLELPDSIISIRKKQKCMYFLEIMNLLLVKCVES